jgi:hypothetical protein
MDRKPFGNPRSDGEGSLNSVAPFCTLLHPVHGRQAEKGDNLLTFDSINLPSLGAVLAQFGNDRDTETRLNEVENCPMATGRRSRRGRRGREGPRPRLR